MARLTDELSVGTSAVPWYEGPILWSLSVVLKTFSRLSIVLVMILSSMQFSARVHTS